MATGGLIGRKKILDTLFEHLDQGKSVLLVGPSGIGKTAILRALKERARQAHVTRRLLHCQQASTLKATLQSLAEELLALDANHPSPADQETVARRCPSKLSLVKLRRLVMPRLRSGRFAVLLDHVGQVRGAYAAFLESLTEDLGIPVVAAMRSLAGRENGRLWWVVWNFEKIQVPALDSGEARALISNCLHNEGVILPDQEAFTKELTRLANGNPRLIARICEMARAPRHQVGGKTDLRLLWLDLTMRDLQQRIDAEVRIPLAGPIPFGPR